jgi:hypothetical protein
MRPVAVFAVLSFGLVAASAKTASAPQGDNERVATTLSGPGSDTAPNAANAPSAARSGKPALRKSKAKPKPPLHAAD